MPARVVDASVIAAWCFREPRADEALSLLDGTDLYEPTLLGFEIASVARQKATLYPGQRAGIFRALQMALALPINWVDVNHLLVLDLALKTGVTTNDAAYLHIARTLRAPLVTFDRNLLQASRQVEGR